MKNPSRTLFGKTWVGWLNILLLQWFFVRLAYGDRWQILRRIVPCTGWWSDYLYVSIGPRIPLEFKTATGEVIDLSTLKTDSLIMIRGVRPHEAQIYLIEYLKKALPVKATILVWGSQEKASLEIVPVKEMNRLGWYRRTGWYRDPENKSSGDISSGGL